MIDFLISHAVLWPVGIPLASAALTACLWDHAAWQRRASRVGVALMFCAALLLLQRVWADGILAVRFGSWDAPFGIVFAVDRFGAAMVAVAGLVATCVMVFGAADIRRREERAGFHPLMHGMLAGINGSFLTGDIFNLYVWFEVMLITSMGLLVIGRTRAQLDGTLKYASLNLFSTVLFLLAVGILYGSTGTLNMADLAQVLPQSEPSASLAVSALLLLAGFGIKAGLFPLFFWLPASYHTASMTVQAIFAGLLTKVGIYAVIRVYTLVFSVEAFGIAEIVAVVAAGTMIFGVLGALTHFDLRRILGFQIVSQLGFMLIGLVVASPFALAASVFYVVHDILVKANLFLLAGAIHRATGTYDIRRAGGLVRSSPVLAILFLLPALSLAGMPPFSGFWGKFLVVDAAFEGGVAWLGGLALLVGLLNLLSMGRVWAEVFWKSPAEPRDAVRSVPLAMMAPIAILGLATLAIGLFPEPFIAFSEAAGADLSDPSAYIETVLGRETMTEPVR